MTGWKAFGKQNPVVIKLPPPLTDSDTSLEEAFKSRRSVRDYSADSLTLQQAAQLLWAAQGITQPVPYGLRTAPSAGALYPLEVILVAGKVKGLDAGVYRYKPASHEIVEIVAGDQRSELCRAALSQESISDAPACIVITGIYQRVGKKYGDRGERYTHIEVGCAVQNIYLQCESLGLGTVVLGAFYDDKVQKVLNLARDEVPLAVMPVGAIK
ncbi:SagB/ThcOx family dehydrogenase [bacterium]|nr:SagB/ThcOx family dehydrogenase [bacterium]MBU1881388.1 SagB/ThcOx family dehydrogenase [bacterium]